MAQSQSWQEIPTRLSVEEFELFVWPHLSKGQSRPGAQVGRACDLQLHPAAALSGLSVEGVAHR
jgi:hypothetical protein